MTQLSQKTTHIRSSRDNQPRILIVILDFNSSSVLPVATALALRTSHHVIVVRSENESSDDLKGANVTLLRGPLFKGEGSAILASVEEARRMGMSHIVTMGLDSLPAADDFVHFTSMIQENPDAIILGRRNFAQGDELELRHFYLCLSNFLLRLQTGKVLKDTQTSFICYPVSVLKNLKLRQRGPAFKSEVIVKAAWSGVTFREVDLSVTLSPGDDKPHRQGFWDIFLITILNIHYTFRAITPIPHRKITANKERPGEKISILRPIESLRTLLTENTNPTQLAAAGALGVFLGTLPLIMCHSIAMLFVASFFRLNKVAAVSASQICMPPVVPAICIEIGYFMHHGRFLTELSVETLGYQALDRLIEWLVGSLVLSPILAALAGIIIYVIARRITKDKGA